MAPRDELGDRREPVELGNSVGSDVDAALTFKAVHGRVVSHSTVRLGNGELDAVTELHRVNLSPENRFEASSLRGNSTATGTFRAPLGLTAMNSNFQERIVAMPQESPNGLTSNQIAERLGVTAGNVSSRLSKLAAYGIIRKKGNVYRALTDEQAASKSPTICSRSPTR